MAESMRKSLEKGEEDGSRLCARLRGDAAVSDRRRGTGVRLPHRVQRDRDRVVYSRAFRRLRQKAVTGILPAYEDHGGNA
jgi:dGTP triphosphohydrolase